MTESHVVCPQCGGTFHWGDGFPDLYGTRVCSLLCRETWLANRGFRGVADAVVKQQFGDGKAANPRQVSDLPLREQQMDIDGPSQFKKRQTNQQMS